MSSFVSSNKPAEAYGVYISQQWLAGQRSAVDGKNIQARLRCHHTQTLLLSSLSSWPLQNVHFQMPMGFVMLLYTWMANHNISNCDVRITEVCYKWPTTHIIHVQGIKYMYLIEYESYAYFNPASE